MNQGLHFNVPETDRRLPSGFSSVFTAAHYHPSAHGSAPAGCRPALFCTGQLRRWAPFPCAARRPPPPCPQCRDSRACESRRRRVATCPAALHTSHCNAHRWRIARDECPLHHHAHCPNSAPVSHPKRVPTLQHPLLIGYPSRCDMSVIRLQSTIPSVASRRLPI